jgi:hypothetical protein
MRLIRLLLSLALAWAILAPSPAVAVTKDINAASFQLQACFDGLLYSLYPLGNCPSGYQATPTILFTDITSGSTTGGENNKGAYLRVFGYSFGSFLSLGVAAGFRLYLDCGSGYVEVDNYRFVRKSFSYTNTQIMEAAVQVGSLGGAGAGTNCSIRATVGGVNTNVISSGFYVQPGRFAFIDPTATNDTAGRFDTIGSPWKYAQHYTGGTGSTNGSVVSASLWCTGSNCTSQGETGFRSGDTIVLRGTSTYAVGTGCNVQWLKWCDNHGGTVPDGTSGKGNNQITCYPGPAGANAPENCSIVGGATDWGGVVGPNGAQATAGYGSYWGISGITVVLNNTQPGTTAGQHGPIDVNETTTGVRIVGNDVSWPTAAHGDGTDCSGPCLSGIGCGHYFNAGVVLGNNIHDIDGGRTQHQNHGVYCAVNNGTIAYNAINNIFGGNGIQEHAGGADSTPQTGGKINNNWVYNIANYGINLNTMNPATDVYNNIVGAVAGHCIDYAPGIGAGTHSTNIVGNTFYGCSTADTAGGSVNGAIQIEPGSGAVAGFINIKYNYVVFPLGQAAQPVAYASNSTDTVVTLANNIYYDARSPATCTTIANCTHSKDASAQAPGACSGGTSCLTNPLFTNPSILNFTLTGSSPGLSYVASCTTPITLSVDFYGFTRPTTNCSTGATQGSGT